MRCWAERETSAIAARLLEVGLRLFAADDAVEHVLTLDVDLLELLVEVLVGHHPGYRHEQGVTGLALELALIDLLVLQKLYHYPQAARADTGRVDRPVG